MSGTKLSSQGQTHTVIASERSEHGDLRRVCSPRLNSTLRQAQQAGVSIGSIKACPTRRVSLLLSCCPHSQSTLRVGHSASERSETSRWLPPRPFTALRVTHWHSCCLHSQSTLRMGHSASERSETSRWLSPRPFPSVRVTNWHSCCPQCSISMVVAETLHCVQGDTLVVMLSALTEHPEGGTLCE